MNNESGMTLLEALIGLLILSFGLLGLAPLLVLSVESNGISQDVLAVSNLAKEKLELYSDPAQIPLVLPYKEVEAEIDSTYHRLTYIWDNSTDTTIAADLAHIRVTIAWIDNTGSTRLSEYTSILQKD